MSKTFTEFTAVIKYAISKALAFKENPQAVAYSAQPLCRSGRETSSPTTHRGAVWKNGAEIP